MALLLLFAALHGGALSPATAADFDKGLAAYKAGDYQTALAEWRPLAEAGDVNAQTMLGLVYAEGKGVPQDNVAAQMWLNLAASKVGPATSKQHQIAVETWDQLASQMSHEAIIQAQALARRCLASNYQDCGD